MNERTDDMTRPDFLKSILHPRALQELPFRDESSDFGLYTSGVGGGNGALDEGNRDKHSDALRRQLEECDAAQGTQVTRERLSIAQTIRSKSP